MDELILQCLTGAATTSQQEQLRRWRERSPENEARYQELMRLWVAATLDSAEPVRSAPDAGDVIDLAHRRGGRGSGGGRGSDALTWLRAAVAAVLAVAIIGAVLLHDRAPGGHALVLGIDEVVTGPNENATIHLRDGTVVRLAGSSRLRVTGTLQDRTVELNNQTYFAVEPQPGSAFLIRTSAGDVHVLGTRFDLDAVGDDLHVVVVQGRVAVDVRGREVEVGAGAVGRVVQGTMLPPVQVADVHRLTEWKSGFLAFQETPISTAAAEISATYGVSVEVLDDVVARRTITTWFSDRTLDEVLRIVCAIVDAQCEWTDGMVHIRAAA